jgi:O-antigen/teichoic acid export membrane protein
MSHSRFYASLILLILLNAVIKPLWIFGVDRQVQNITGVVEYGTYFSLLNLSIVFGFLLDWGLTNFINRELAAKKTDLQAQLGSFLVLKILFAILYAAVVIAVAAFSGVQRWDIVWAVITIQFLTFLFVFLRGVVTANQWFSTDAFLSVLDKSLMIIACAFFLLGAATFGRITIDKFLMAQITCTAIAVLVTFAILFSRGLRLQKPGLRFLNKKLFLAIFPFAMTVFLMSAHFRLDGFLLERLHHDGAHQAGIYAGAYRLLDASNMIGYLIASFFMPFVARLASEKKPLQDTILQTRHIQMMFAVAMVGITLGAGPWLENILYHRSDAYSIHVLQISLSALIGYSLMQVYGTVMTATGNIVAFCLLNGVALFFNALLNIIFIPRYGAMGCAVVAIFSELFLGLSTMIFVHQKLKTPVDIRSLFIYLVTGAAAAALLYFFPMIGIHPIIGILMTGLVVLGIMWATKLGSLNTWLGFLKKQ